MRRKTNSEFACLPEGRECGPFLLSVSRNLFESNGMEVNERVFIKAITTCPSAKSHFVDVFLVYWKTLHMFKRNLL